MSYSIRTLEDIVIDWLRTATVIGATVLASGSVTIAQTPSGAKKAPPTPDSLIAITERGRLLAEHDGAAWVATDSVH